MKWIMDPTVLPAGRVNALFDLKIELRNRGSQVADIFTQDAHDYAARVEFDVGGAKYKILGNNLLIENFGVRNADYHTSSGIRFRAWVDIVLGSPKDFIIKAIFNAYQDAVYVFDGTTIALGMALMATKVQRNTIEDLDDDLALQWLFSPEKDEEWEVLPYV